MGRCVLALIAGSGLNSSLNGREFYHVLQNFVGKRREHGEGD